jgi:acetyl esterase/lipase
MLKDTNCSSQDNLLRFYADNCDVTVISVGYRLAPEDPYPAGPNDCYDAAEYFVDHAKEKYGSEMMFTGGEVC